MKADTLEQQVVIYDPPGETGKVYDTCYSESQMQHTLLRCRNNHGASCNARVLTGRRRFDGEKR
jgi:hypothetical protein